jgi:hypothetical protein
MPNSRASATDGGNKQLLPACIVPNEQEPPCPPQ